jgi:regulator of RNase E activity RraA
VIGDADGMLCMPFAKAETILAAAQKKSEAEVQTIANHPRAKARHGVGG